MRFIKTFEELSDNDYRNDDPISKLKMIEIIYDTLMDNGGDTISLSKVEDPELDMESAEINFKYDGVHFKLLIERVEGVKECAVAGVGVSAPGSPNAPTLPRSKSVKQLKKFKTGKTMGGKNVLNKKNIVTKESVQNDDFFEITTPIHSKDFNLFQEIVNKGIDSHLESFVKSKFEKNGNRFIFNFHKLEVDILLRRLQEMWEASEDDNIYNWIEDIKNYMK
jgi:hypothetical protein